MDFLIPPGIKDLGLGGLVILGLLSLIRGWLLPRSVHEDRMADLKDQIKEKNTRIEFLQEALGKRDEQLDEMIRNNAVAVSALEAIRREAARA